MQTAFAAPFIGWIVLRHGVLMEDGLEHRTLFEQMCDGVVVLDEEHRVIAINTAGERFANELSSDPLLSERHLARHCCREIDDAATAF